MRSGRARSILVSLWLITDILSDTALAAEVGMRGVASDASPVTEQQRLRRLMMGGKGEKGGKGGKGGKGVKGKDEKKGGKKGKGGKEKRDGEKKGSDDASSPSRRKGKGGKGEGSGKKKVSNSSGKKPNGKPSGSSKPSGKMPTRHVNPKQDDDMGIRYNKIVFEEDGMVMPRYLGPKDYPLWGDMGSMLRESQCISVVMQEDCMECVTPFHTLVMDVIGGYPLHPSSDPDSPFWDDFFEVVQAQKKRLANAPTTDVMPVAETWSHYTIAEAAEAVHDELPGWHHGNLIQYLLKEGAEVDGTIMPKYSREEFVRGAVALADISTWAIGTTGPQNFGVKWHVGRARPEELAWKIATDELTEADGVPSNIVDCIDDFSLTSAESFTAYPEGSPDHPSFPAMHSAASAGSLWLPVLMNLTPEQICQTQLVDFDIAFARTIAGVHYPSDNIAGLTLGQEIVAKYLPDYMAERYGSDKEAVKAKVEQFRFNWDNFLSSDCVNGWTPTL